MKKNTRLKAFSYIEISIEPKIPGPGSKAEICDFAEACGIEASSLAFFELKEFTRAAAYVRSRRLLNKVKRAYAELRKKNFRLKWKILEREDWYDKWQLEYQIMPLGKSFMLVPLWQKERFRGSKVPIFLDPKGAFGSGTHPTTQLMIALMEEIRGRFSDFLDLGTGTGILSIAARHMGAECIYALDKDPASVRAAKFNTRFNGVKMDFLKTGDIMAPEFKRKFEAVGINVISTVLMDARKKIWSYVKSGGYLAVSGIHLQNLEEVKASLNNPDFTCLRVLKKRGWAGILYKRKNGR